MKKEQEDYSKTPFLVSLDAIKAALKTLPIEEIQALKEIIDEIIEEHEKENAE
jgi:hypothetical protein